MSVFTSKTRILPRIVAVIFAVFALIFSSVMVPQAHAAENTNIVVNISPLQKSLDSGSPTEGSVRVNELVRMDATWDASNANPQPGDTFTIPLPPEFESRQAGAKVDLQFDGKVVGECRSELKQVSCSLNDQITCMVDIKGTF